MKRLDRYVLSSFAASLAAAFVILTGLYVLIHFASNLKDIGDMEKAFATRQMSVMGGICRYYLLSLPEVIVLFGPYAILLAGMYALHQLNQNNELVPMFALGVSRLRVATPIILVAVLVSLGLSGMKEKVIPGLAREMVTMHRLMKGKDDSVFRDLPLVTDSRGDVFVCESWDNEQRRLHNVWFQSSGRDRASHFPWLEWSDRDGGRWQAPEGVTKDDMDLLHRSDLTPEDLDLLGRTRVRQSFTDLRLLVRKKPERRDLEVLMHSHLTYPFTALVLLFLGLPLVMRVRRKHVFAGLGVCFLLSLSFFSSSLVLHRLGTQGDVVSPAMGAWLPIVFFGVVGVLLFETSES